MTINSAGAYTSSIDFRISTTPPNLDPPNAASIEEIYSFSKQVIQAFIDVCGTDPQQQLIWPQLAGNPNTVRRGNLGRFYVQASEAILGYNAVSLHNVGGFIRARNANAANNSRPCDGFTGDVSGIAVGSVGEVILHSGVAQFSGLVPGTRYYLDTTNGIVTAVKPVAAGNIEQYVGVALDSTHLAFNLGGWIQH